MHDNGAKSGGSWGTMLFGLALIAAAAGWWYFSRDAVETAQKGPTPITTEDLLAMGEGKEPPSRWVSFTATGDFVATDVRVMKNVTQEVAKFVLVPVGKRYFIAEVEPDFSGRTYEGQLAVWSGGVQGEAVTSIRQSVGNAAGRVLQFQLDTRTDPRNSVMAGYALQGMLAAVGLIVLVVGLCGRALFSRDDEPEFATAGAGQHG